MSASDVEPASQVPEVSSDLRDCLIRIGRVMEHVEEHERLMLTIIEQCKTLLRCDAASVALYDPELGDLSFAVASGGEDEQTLKQWRIPIGKGIVGMVAESREPLYSNDPENDPRWFGKIAKSSGFETRNLAAAPMVRGEGLIGVLEVLNRPGEQGFDDNDLALLQIFADQVAVALVTHRLIKDKEESQRLATFGYALADIGHSVKNILMRLQFPISLMDMALDKEDWEIYKNSWPTMKRATVEITHLVNDMLTYSKPREPDIAQTDIAAMAKEIAQGSLADAQSKNIDLRLNNKAGELIWPLDAKGLRSALNNILGNAIEAVHEHGGSKVTLTIETCGNPEELRITIADDGPGIPPEIQRRIFDPFFSTKKSKGTGLGLANVKKSVEEHGGRVVLDSEPGKGAAFILIFPHNEAADP